LTERHSFSLHDRTNCLAGRGCVAARISAGAEYPLAVVVSARQGVKELCVLAGHASRIAALAFAKDGRLLASGDRDGCVFVWDTTTAAPIHAAPLQGPFPFQLCFSPDGRRLVALDREQAKLWDVDSGHEVLILRAAPLRGGDEGFNPQLAWSPDGRRLATLNWNRTLSVWDAGEAYSARKSSEIQEPVVANLQSTAFP
jgi:WD40 repeat protein